MCVTGLVVCSVGGVIVIGSMYFAMECELRCCLCVAGVIVSEACTLLPYVYMYMWVSGYCFILLYFISFIYLILNCI